MPHRGWRVGIGGAESTPADRLTPDRLAGFLSFLRSVSPETSEESQAAEAPEQTPATVSPAAAEAQNKQPERSVTGAEPQAAKTRVADSSPGGRPPETAPTLAATSVARVLGAPRVAQTAPTTAVAPAEGASAVVEPAVVESAVVGPAISEPDVARNKAHPAGSKKGRHRLPRASHHGIRGIAFTTRRLAILGALTVAVVAAVVLALI